ncbi:unknown [Fusobacterium sp. CAG:439]|nr:unknown [Fusobacterium sp. CAG:439]
MIISMNINYVLLRQISVLSIFFGALLGAITLIPYVGTLSFIFLICFISPIVIWILVKYNCLSLSSIKDSVIVGALAGFVSYMGFSIIYVPISVILMKFFHIAANYGVGLMLENANFFILVVISLFLGVLSATVNAFTGFLTFYVIDIVNSMRK